MKVSQNNQGLQKTKYLGSSAKDRVELKDRQTVHREFSAISKGQTNELEYGSLDRMLSRPNTKTSRFSSFLFNSSTYDLAHDTGYLCF